VFAVEGKTIVLPSFIHPSNEKPKKREEKRSGRNARVETKKIEAKTIF